MFQSAGQRAALLPTLPGRPGAGTSQAADRRADGHKRSISLTRDVVSIDRCLKGIAMRVAVPVRAYRGVALSLLQRGDGALSYQLNLLHPDADLSVTLDQACDDCDILADWRLWSRFFRLPALVERETGLVEPADTTVGAVTVGSIAVLRRPSRSRSKRRPMFLIRRKAGIAAIGEVSHTGEREIIART